MTFTSSSSELVLLLLAVELCSDPPSAILVRRPDQHVLVLLVEPRLAHLFHGWDPELVVKQKLNALLLVRDLAESVS